MSLGRVALLVAFLFLFSTLHSNTQQAITPAGGPFQLMPAQVTLNNGGSTWDERTVFLIDSRNGQIWEYVSLGVNKEGKYREPVMAPVNMATSPN